MPLDQLTWCRPSSALIPVALVATDDTAVAVWVNNVADPWRAMEVTAPQWLRHLHLRVDVGAAHSNGGGHDGADQENQLEHFLNRQSISVVIIVCSLLENSIAVRRWRNMTECDNDESLH